MEYLKKNWLSILLSILGLLGGADAVAGVRQGKDITNLTVIPGLLAALGSSSVLGVRWLNSRTVSARAIRQSLAPEFLERIETLYTLARDPDVTDSHAAHLADMAGDLLLAEHRRAQSESRKNQLSVIDGQAFEVARLAEIDSLKRQLAELTSQASQASQTSQLKRGANPDAV